MFDSEGLAGIPGLDLETVFPTCALVYKIGLVPYQWIFYWLIVWR